MSDTIISGAPAPAAAAPAVAAAAATPVVDVAALQAQIDELKEQTAEATRTAQYWADKARSGAPAPAAAAVAEEEPDVLEAITTGGAKGFDALAAKRGFIKRDEVEQLITARANSLTEEQQLMQDYPDLKRKDSEFFKATAREYGNLVKNGMPQVLAMGTAARSTELAFIKAGTIKLPAAAAAATAEEKEATRLRRIAAQGGGGNNRPAPGEEEGTELTPQQKHIAHAMGITEEAYAKRANAGVAMRGGTGGR